MTTYSYEVDPYLRELATEVLETGERDGRPFAILGDTLFYPGGGGQPVDRGTLNDVSVVEVQKREGRIVHLLDAPVPQGPAMLRLDWQRRFDHMQQHTAQHLISASALDLFDWRTTAFHLGERQSDIELDVRSVAAEQLRQLEEVVAESIRNAHPISTRSVTRQEYETLNVRSRGLPDGHEGEIRLVEIEGIDLNTCGGTHLHSTAEMEAIKLLTTESLRGGTRIFWVAGGRVRSLLGEHFEQAAQLRKLVGTSDEEMLATVSQKLRDLRAAESTTRQLEKDLAAHIATELSRRREPFIDLHLENTGPSLLQLVGRQITQQPGSMVALLTADGAGGSDSADGFFFVLCAAKDSPTNLQELGRQTAELLDGRGGGSGPLFQGKAGSLSGRPQVIEFLRQELDL